MGQREHPAHPLGVHRDDGRRRADAGHRRSRSSTRTTWPSASSAHYPVLYPGKRGRVAHEFILDLRPFKKTRRGRGRRHRQAPDGLRLPLADDVVPGRRHFDDRAHRERAARRAGPLLRRDDCDPRGDPRDRGWPQRPRRQPAEARAAHRRHRDQRPVVNGRASAGSRPRSRRPGRGPRCARPSTARWRRCARGAMRAV